MQRCLLAIFTLAFCAGAQAASEDVSLNLVTSQSVGQAVGSVKITETDRGLEFTPDLRALPPGKHGFHIHAEGAIILLSHFLSFYFKCFKVAAVMLVIDLVVKWYKIRIFFGDIIHNCLFETASKILSLSNFPSGPQNIDLGTWRTLSSSLSP